MPDEPQAPVLQDTGVFFFSGWRPLIGWISVIALSLQFVVAPIVRFTSILIKHPIDLPNLDVSSINSLCLSVLGFGTLRTAEKWSGVQNRH